MKLVEAALKTTEQAFQTNWQSAIKIAEELLKTIVNSVMERLKTLDSHEHDKTFAHQVPFSRPKKQRPPTPESMTEEEAEQLTKQFGDTPHSAPKPK